MKPLAYRRWLLTFVLLHSTPLFARPGVDWRGNPGWEPEGAYCRLYDTKTVVTLQGTVQKVEKVIPMKGMGNGVHFFLVGKGEAISVQLGPVWYIEKQPLQIQAKDSVEVIGSRVPCDGKMVILASEVRRGSDVLKLRDAAGKPLWSVWQAAPASKN